MELINLNMFMNIIKNVADVSFVPSLLLKI